MFSKVQLLAKLAAPRVQKSPIVLTLKGRNMGTHHKSESEEPILFERKGNVVSVTLNRPKALNALNLDMVRKLTPKYQEYERDPTIKAVVLKGMGNKAFCAGGDIRAIYDSKKTGGPLGSDFFREEYILNHLIGTLHTNHIALLDGITMGGGVGLSVHGKFRIATENTLFAMPETAIGFFCDVGGSHFLPRLPGELGMYLGLTGARLKGIDVLKTHVATHWLPSARLPEFENALVELTKKTDHTASDIEIDKLIREFAKPHQEEIINHKSDIDAHREEIDRLFNKKSVEDIIFALEAENTPWAKETLTNMKKMSPTSLKVVFKSLRDGAKLPLDECLKMEYRISQKFMEGHDFFEGVRALLVDKDKNAKWQPASVTEVSDEVVERYFSKLGSNELQLTENKQRNKKSML
eukprot:TRINITY_DN9413_c0_g1_i1.p1 TRINITY_DN9413_c0_g1~~TRINITY_DN9413_c0_g1_i1.p1  ORF type:complete len:409 (-),score=108.12 TRINITY_DN9413_c0_g1_i1:13-1239(-)